MSMQGEEEGDERLRWRDKRERERERQAGIKQERAGESRRKHPRRLNI